ncbi:MAG TPA: hypothetical protein VH186_34525 [Chloroflexia bacterium]|nr:hypothetical protein [Chloroflexia bacterium]
MSVEVLSILAVAGAWISGLGVIFAVASFCFGFIKPRLFRFGLTYLLITDAGLILMLAALLGILNDTTLWVFSLIGLVLLVGFTIAAFVIVRGYAKNIPSPATVLETTRRRIEF